MRSQQGNNNAYCQDNEISWFNWHRVVANKHMVEFVRKIIALTCRFTILQRRKFYLGKDLDANNIPDLSWSPADGGNPNWGDPELRTLCLQLDGSEEESALGDYQLFIILNADFHLQSVNLPKLTDKKKWYRVLDTSLPTGEEIMMPGHEIILDPNDIYLVNPRSTVMLLGRKQK